MRSRQGLTGLLVSATLAIQSPAAGVRSSDRRLSRVVQEAYTKSATFRSMVDALKRTDIILYVEPGDCECGRAAACLSLVSSGGNVRYLRATVPLRRIDDELGEQIGHELQHALEIAAEPTVTSASTLAAFYSRHGSRCGMDWCFETEAARTAGHAVRREISRSPIF